MTEEELIALSDLNREDNIKYITSEAQGIAITLNSDKYAPTLCKLERAYICGRRKSEERIEKLDKENGKLEGKLADLQSEYVELENFHNNEVNELKAQIEELKKENAELRKVAEFQQSNNMNRHFENKKLKECLTVGTTWNKALNSMNKALEEERDKYRNMVFDKDEQLKKAKEIIKKFSEFANFEVEYDPEHPQEHTDLWNELCEKAEQFLKEIEE